MNPLTNRSDQALRNALIAIVIIGIIAAAYYLYAKKQKAVSDSLASPEVPAEGLGSSLYAESDEQAAEAVAETLPETNPVKQVETNPFKNVYNNPFE